MAAICNLAWCPDRAELRCFACPANRPENWRPIATAPKDGTHIQACRAGSSFGWRDGKPLPPWQTVVHWWGHGTPGFYPSVYSTQNDEPLHGLTHWKPLDAPNAGVTPPRSAHDAIMAMQIRTTGTDEFARGYRAGAADMQRSAAMVAKQVSDGVREDGNG